MALPPFTPDGVLPPGDYPLTFAELRQSLLVVGKGRSASWDAAWRLYLVQQCEVLVRQLWTAGIQNVYLDGSFVEEKDHPNDIDGYFECDLMDFATGNLQRRLNALDPHKVWTWDKATRRPANGFAKWQLPMWHHYRVELYPHWGQGSGIRDQYGNELTFPSAFRQRRSTYQPKGIVRVVPE
ncbi:DUF6932 family protein [Calidithermus chliarophilus]|uniref:DUF6932 family protein n=1 Tax=Calidithermus chliarophilus TaxID=52023 RepID=UPI001C54CD48|nr:hypothetical protein [Calidithermus chliarophilus]